MFEGIKKLLGDSNASALKKTDHVVVAVNNLEPEYEKLTDEQIKEKTEEFKETLMQ